MTVEEKVRNAFEIFPEVETLYSAEDGSVFIRIHELEFHCSEGGYYLTKSLEWIKEYGARDNEFTVRPYPMYDAEDVLEEEYVKNGKIEEYSPIQEAIAIILRDHPEFEEEHTTGWNLIQALENIDYEHCNNKYSKTNT